MSAPRAVFQAVPPTPVLPRQALAEHMNGTAEKPPAPVLSRSAERAPAQKDGENGVAQPMPPALPTPGKSGNGAFPTTEQFKVDLLRAVSERTGYPEDMLDLDAHMEADLGIDSIKRIEIFSGLQGSLQFHGGAGRGSGVRRAGGSQDAERDHRLVRWNAQSDGAAKGLAKGLARRGRFLKKSPGSTVAVN